jgi:hypothetical protein
VDVLMSFKNHDENGYGLDLALLIILRFLVRIYLENWDNRK